MLTEMSAGQIRHGSALDARGISFIGIQVKLQTVPGRHSHDHLAEDGWTDRIGDLDFDHIPVGNAESLRILRTHVNVAQRADNAAVQRHLASRTHQGQPGRLGQVARQA